MTTPSPTQSAHQQDWNKYGHGFTYFTSKFQGATDLIRGYADDPLVPRALGELLLAYDQVCDALLPSVRMAMINAAAKMPAHHASLDTFEGEVDLAWVDNIWNDKRPALKPSAEAITSYIRDYLQSDELRFRGRMS